MFKSIRAARYFPVLFLFFIPMGPGYRLAAAVPGAGYAFAFRQAFQDSLQPGSAATPDSIPGQLDNPTYNLMLDRAIRYQERADSLRRLAVERRKEAGGMVDPVLRGKLQGRIEKLEDSVRIYGKLADEHFNYLGAESPLEGRPGPQHPYLVRDTVLNGITVYRYDLTDEFMARLDTIREEGKTVPGNLQAGPGNGTAETLAGKKKSKSPERMETLDGEEKSISPGTGGFRIMDSSPYNPGHPFEKDYTLPPGVFYRIQIAVYSKEIEPGHFGGLSPITSESIPGRDLTRYFAGKFTRMDDAGKALLKVRALGYPDAFIIGYYNGQKSSFSKLRALEE